MQVHDVPYRFMNRAVAESICETVGIVSKSTRAVDEEGGTFIRVRVTLNVSLPLCRGGVITLESGEKIWVSFKYERLPNICYWCGCLTHDDKNCELWIQSRGTLTTEQQQYGPNLRSPPFRLAGKDVIYVPGYYDRRPMRPRAVQPNDKEFSGMVADQTNEGEVAGL